VVLDKVRKAVDAEGAIHHELPPLILLMTKPREVDPNLVALGDMGSTYRDNFCRNTDISYVEARPEFDFKRPIEPLGAHLNKAAKILSVGTTKMTYQVPGYKGHIPTNMRNLRKMEHASGKTAHPVYNNLVLSQRGMGCVLGYAGYVPVEQHFPRTERMTSCDPRTSNGAAYAGKRSML
jgi:hypothetical protein